MTEHVIDIIKEMFFRLKCLGVEPQVTNMSVNGHREAIIVLSGYRWDEEHKKLVKRKGT